MIDAVDCIKPEMSKADFNLFLEQMLKEIQSGRGEWENNTLDRFLEAMLAWSNDADGYYKNFNLEIDHQVASWRVFADLLAAARVYE